MPNSMLDRCVAMLGLSLLMGCGDGVLSPLDQMHRVRVDFADDSIVAGGWVQLFYHNGTAGTVRADRCRTRIQYAISAFPENWLEWSDSRLDACGSDTLVVARGQSANVFVPVPIVAGRYRIRLDWTDGEGRTVEMASSAFHVPYTSPVTMQLLEERLAPGDSIRVRFHNVSSQAWRVDPCAAVRFEYRPNATNLGWVDAGARPNACAVAPFDLQERTDSVTVTIPLWDGLGWAVRLRAGFAGDFGETVVGWSGMFRVL